MTDTQTAFVLVPREMDDGMMVAALRAGYMISGATEQEADTLIKRWLDTPSKREFSRAQYAAALSAAPKPPESEIGPVAWVLPAVIEYLSRVGTHYMRGSFTATEVYTEPLYPQARIDADAAEKAELLARVKELEDALEPFSDIDGEGDEDFDGGIPVEIRFGRSVVYRPVTLGDFRRARAALASKKETVDE